MRRSSLCVGLLFSAIAGYCQTTTSEPAILNETTTAEQPTQAYVPFQAGPITVFDERDNASFTVTSADEQTIQNRLATIQNIMPFTYNETVRQFIDFFMYRRPSFAKSMMEKKDLYFPVFEAYLAKYQMPDELKYLSLIESGLNPKAVSRANAVGLWQFMSFTGREQGLRIDEFVDERMHIEKSTDAACRYLRTLYNMFGDWDLALASYNSGPGTIRRALRRSGKTSYWDIHPFIPKDTRTYVPQFIAIAYMMNYGPLHGILPENVQKPIPYKTFMADGYLDLRKLADMSQMDFTQIQQLNPHIRKEVLPAYTRQFELRLPAATYGNFAANQQAILAEASRIYVPQPTVVEQPTQNTITVASAAVAMPILNAAVAAEPAPQPAEPSVAAINAVNVVEDLPAPTRAPRAKRERIAAAERPAKPRKQYHKVRRGENLIEIADRYNVSVSDLKDWNNLRSSKIMVGKRLAIISDKAVAKEVAVSARNSRSKASDVKKSTYHTVKPGDTLWNISQRYDGVTVSDLKKLNKLNGSTLKVGQKLKINVS